MPHNVPREPYFTFRNGATALHGRGEATPFPPGPATTRAARMLANPTAEHGLLAGVLPFHPADDDHLWQVTRHDGVPTPPLPGRPAKGLHTRDDPSPQHYADIVAKALRIMKDEADLPDGLAKIVLARSLIVRAAEAIPTGPLLDQLALDPAVTAFRVPLPGADRWLVGATPELLVRKDGHDVLSHPLAGSARRDGDPTRDRAAADALLRSDKDRREHAIVVEYILDTLSPYCHDLACPDGTTLTSTQTMWHLGTRIAGRLRDATMPSLLLATALHPTPAVCGLPARRAADLIQRLEPAPRGFYSGAVGWCDAKGCGTWYVAIRCAEVCGPEARLFAGAGIVPGSDPWAEVDETGAKFGALLAALGLPLNAANTHPAT